MLINVRVFEHGLEFQLVFMSKYAVKQLNNNQITWILTPHSAIFMC